MRKLEEHFCTFEQEEKLINLGFDHHQKVYVTDRETNYIILRSQALDFFRDKGYKCAISPFILDDKNEVPYIADNTFGYFIFKNHKFVFDGVDFETYPEAESALIDKLIEIQMEVQNGK